MKILAIIILTYLIIEGTIAKSRSSHHKHFRTKVKPNYRKTNSLKRFGHRIYGLPNKEAGRRVLSWRIGDKVNPEELGGYAEGDILFTGGLKNGWAAEEYRWPGKTIPYTISKYSFTKRDLAMIQSAIDDIHNQTCVRFVPRTNERAHIRITSKFAGCYSSIGHNGQSYNVNLQSGGCTSVKGTVLHELMHAIGFVHEQSRAERDDYVQINWNNIARDDKFNFDRYPRSYMKYYDVPYDYFSVMHYSRYALSKNGGQTIVPKDNSISEMGQRDGFSKGDILKINRMYKCGDEPHSKNRVSTTKKHPHITKRIETSTSRPPRQVTPRPVYRDRVYCLGMFCWKIRTTYWNRWR